MLVYAGDKPSASKVFRCAGSKDGFPQPRYSTCYDNFAKTAAANPDSPCLGSRRIGGDGAPGDFEFDTYAQVADTVEKISGGLAALGVTAGQRVGVYGELAQASGGKGCACISRCRGMHG